MKWAKDIIEWIFSAVIVGVVFAVFIITVVAILTWAYRIFY